MSESRLTNCGTGSSNWQMGTRCRAGMEKPRRSTPAASDKARLATDRKSTRLNSSHSQISYAVFCLKKKKQSHPKDKENRLREQENHLASYASHDVHAQQAVDEQEAAHPGDGHGLVVHQDVHLGHV